MPSVGKTEKSSGISKFLLSPHFTGLLLPAIILAVGAVYHLVTIRQHQQTEKELREELRVLRDDKESLESRLKSLEREVEEPKKQSMQDAKSARLLRNFHRI